MYVVDQSHPKHQQGGGGYGTSRYAVIRHDTNIGEINTEITEWYSVENIQSKYGMTLSAIYYLASKVGIPKRKEGPKVYYSKYHFDVAKGAKSAEDIEFISVADAMEKYSMTRDQLIPPARC